MTASITASAFEYDSTLGIGISGFAQVSDTSNTVFNQYQQNVAVIADYLNPPSGVTAPSPGQVQLAINTLKHLVTNGLTLNVDPNDPTSPLKKYYLTTEMAQQLTSLFSTLSSVGVPTGSSPITITSTQLASWKDLVNVTGLLQGLITFAATTNNRSIQALIELDYVKTGNDMLSQQLTPLQNALETTQSALNNLATLQQIHNQVYFPTKGPLSTVTGFHFIGTQATSTLIKGYQSAASAYFGTPIVPTIGDPYDISDPVTNYLFNLAQKINEDPGYAIMGVIGNNNTSLSQMTVNFNDTHLNFLSREQLPPAVISKFHLVLHSPTSENLLNDVPGGAGGNHTYFEYNTNDTTIANGDTYETNSLLYTLEIAKDALKLGYTIDGNNLTVPYGDPLRYTNKLAPYNTLNLANGLPSILPPLIQPKLVDAKNKLVTLLASLSAQITSLSGIVPRIPPGAVPGTEDPAGLTAKMRTVYTDLLNTLKTSSGARITASTSYADAYSGVSKWLLDGYNTSQSDPAHSSSGAFQQDITFAITSAQSLNDSQKESVRRFLYVFEEYYKSAAAILTALKDIITRMAQAVGR